MCRRTRPGGARPPSGPRPAGAIDVGGSARLTLDSSVSVAIIAFAAGGGALQLGAPQHVSGTIHGFGTGDTIELLGLEATSLQFSGGRLSVYDGQTRVDTLHFAGPLTSGDFGLAEGKLGDARIVYAGSSQDLSTAAVRPSLPDTLHMTDPLAWHTAGHPVG